MNQNKIHMIVGAAGMIGSALTQCLQKCSEKVIAADVWVDGLSQEKIHLDLASDASQWALPDVVKTVYMCAGITKLEECRKDPEGTAKVNVEGTIQLTKAMMDKGAFIVFLSSNQVFDGTIANVPANQPQNPKNEYGRQKTAVEKFLSQYPEQSAIVRLTKVVGPNSIFSKWAQSLRKGQPIYPFTDMVVSPIPLTTVISVLRMVGDQQLGGIWQISGEEDLTYQKVAFLIGEILDIELSLIKPWSIAEAKLDFENNPNHTTMDMGRIREELGLLPPIILDTVKQATTNIF